jgi:GrpB-like predicted nucleotidyltransferase (UPF0157 family)/SAM-dependent methyltransferase
MARVDYDLMSADYDRGRDNAPARREAWRDALVDHLPTGGPVLDLGSGTGQWSSLLADWFDLDVVALEPSSGMRRAGRGHPRVRAVAGVAEALPLRDGCLGSAWISAVWHHVPDQSHAAAELHRVLRPGARVCIRGAFPDAGDLQDLPVVRAFPEAADVLATFTSLAELSTQLKSAGFTTVLRTGVTELGSADTWEMYHRASRRVDTLLALLPDEIYAARLRALETAARSQPPVAWPARLPLLVVEKAGRPRTTPAGRVARPAVAAPALRVQLAGPDPVAVAAVARRLDTLGGGRLDILTNGPESAVALVISVGAGPDPHGTADLALIPETAGRTADELWRDRLGPWCDALSGLAGTPAPATLRPSDPSWQPDARNRLARLSAALRRFVDPDRPWAFDHIGSTAVDGLAAKDFVDLQVRVPVLPPRAALEATLAPLGYLPAVGSRPDSPGVHRDTPCGDEVVPDAVWDKRLFVAPDPVRPVILHVRLAASPFGRHTVWFRDWLRAHPGERDAYETVKRDLASAHAHQPDYDDYTRAKGEYLHRVEAQFVRWGRAQAAT